MSDAYLRQVLNRHMPNSSAPGYAGILATQLVGRFPEIQAATFSGSYAKGTAVSVGSSGSDIDLFLSFSAGTFTLRDVYQDVYTYVAAQGMNPRKQNVSIGLHVNGFKVDLVPARQQAGYQNYHSLYVRKADSWRQTNVLEHVRLVSQSGRTEEIRVLKIWRTLHQLDWPSFYLELTVMEALRGRRGEDLANNVWTALIYIRDHLLTTRIVDPTNSNNLISETMTGAEKQAVVRQASVAISGGQWGAIVW